MKPGSRFEAMADNYYDLSYATIKSLQPTQSAERRQLSPFSKLSTN